MKVQPKNSASLSVRCLHRDASGRQCRILARNPHSGLCPKHHAEHQQLLAADHYQHLSTNFQFLQTAQGINYSLMNLYQLLAQNRISPRRASVLAYINSLLLRTLPAIDADNAAGITDPTILPAKPSTVPTTVLVPDKNVTSDPAPVPDPLKNCDLSTPEPDPKKKPS